MAAFLIPPSALPPDMKVGGLCETRLFRNTHKHILFQMFAFCFHVYINMKYEETRNRPTARGKDERERTWSTLMSAG